MYDNPSEEDEKKYKEEIGNIFIDAYPSFTNRFNLDKNLYQIVCNEDAKFPGGVKDEVLDIFWKNNSGYNGLVLCEHITFNFAAINDGYKIFANPKMTYKWS